jgi:MscS family membrane protein
MLRCTIALAFALISGTIGAANPLKPLDTSSPRATFESFLALTEEAASRYHAFRNAPSPATQAALWQISEKAARLFDLSQVGPAARPKVADETFYLLWDVIARLELPDHGEIPAVSVDEDDVEQADQPIRWRIPDTEITIVRISEGEHAGEFRFSPDTVKEARRFYEAVLELPYRRPMPIEDVYRVNQLTTGWMIPLAWVEALPDWANTLLHGQVLWKWIALAVAMGLALGAVYALYRWGRRKPWNGTLGHYLRYITAPLAVLLLAPLLHYLAWQQINITSDTAELPIYFLEVAEALAAVWIVWLTASVIAETVITRVHTISSKGLNAHLIRLTARSIGLFAVVVLVFRVAHEVGIPVYGLVAGAGVGGLAVALAARSTLENFMGTLNLYADRPVRVDDFCRYGEDPSPGWLRIGTIEEIGLRSTRIRGIDRTVTTIPNAEFANMHIVNLTKRDRMVFRPTLALRYETTGNQLRFVLAQLRELLLAHPRVTDDPARVRFAGFADYAMNVEIFAYVNTADWNEFLAIQEDIHLRILDIVERAGTGFAVPSRTLYHTRDGGLDAERRQVAEKEVREWASAHRLPFPEFPPDHRDRIMDTLDYPPEGSPGADRG